jgi:hypothetical protein
LQSYGIASDSPPLALYRLCCSTWPAAVDKSNFIAVNPVINGNTDAHRHR